MKSYSKFPKILLFILSMAPFFVILGLMCMDIPVTFEKDAEFIGWSQLWENIKFGVYIILISIILEYAILKLFEKVCCDVSGEQTELVTKVENRNFELLSFVTSVFLPLISFQYDQLSHWLVTLLIIILIGHIFCISDGYFTNPTLAIFHFRLYEVELDNMNRNSRKMIILCKSSIAIGDKIRCVALTDKVSYANLE